MPVITVAGVIDYEDLGITLPHEHLFVDLSFAYEEPKDSENKIYANQKVSLNTLHLLKYNPALLRDNLVLDEEDIADELLQFKIAGGKTLVEQSSIGAGRSTEAIQNISRLVGIHIITGTGYYLKQSLPPDIVNAGEATLLKNIIREVRHGINGTEIRPGIIGELGIGPAIEDWEKKLLKVAAEAQRETGLAVFIHIQAVPTLPNFSGKLNGMEVIKILENAGASLDKVAICHTDAKIDLEYIKNITRHGVYAEFDHIGKDYYYPQTDFLMDRDMDRVLALKELIDNGCIEKILISQDVCLKTDLIKYGGFGYAHILKNIVPLMMKRGITQKQVDTVMVENPKVLLNVEQKYL
jgi:phosphotriesterase-related protein